MELGRYAAGLAVVSGVVWATGEFYSLRAAWVLVAIVLLSITMQPRFAAELAALTKQVWG